MEATHRCKICGALWRLNPPSEVQPDGSWTVVTPELMRSCCDNEFMGDQIEVLAPSERDAQKSTPGMG